MNELCNIVSYWSQKPVIQLSVARKLISVLFKTRWYKLRSDKRTNIRELINTVDEDDIEVHIWSKNSTSSLYDW